MLYSLNCHQKDKLFGFLFVSGNETKPYFLQNVMINVLSSNILASSVPNSIQGFICQMTIIKHMLQHCLSYHFNSRFSVSVKVTVAWQPMHCKEHNQTRSIKPSQIHNSALFDFNSGYIAVQQVLVSTSDGWCSKFFGVRTSST